MSFDQIKDIVSFFNDSGGLLSLLITSLSALAEWVKKNTTLANLLSFI